MTRAEYVKIRALNWSRLRAMAVSPLQYRYVVENPPPDTGTFRLGRAVHAAVLEPEAFERRYVVYDGAVRRGRTWEAFEADHAGQEILIAGEMEAARGCAAAVLAHPVAQRYLGDGLREETFCWKDKDTGVPCKGCADLISDRLLELKTARDVDPWRFGAQFARLLYGGQLAWYLDGARTAGHPLPLGPVVIAVQPEPPWDVAVYLVPEQVVEAGRALYRRLLDALKGCVESGRWPGVCETELELSLPTWAYGVVDGEEEPLTIGGEAAF
jgi:exodeoxyribonuclease VIII